jgi:ribonuclease BN (tRNA processing enzyme)
MQWWDLEESARVSEVLFVGTGDAFGSGRRRNSAILVRSKGQSLLLDCGPTTLGGLKTLGVDPREIGGIVLTHFHGDHSAGIPFLLLDEIFENRRTEPLVILGPPGVEERVWEMCRAFSYPDHNERSYQVRFRELSQTQPIELGGFRVAAYPAHHQPETRPHMVSVCNASQQVFFTGDTGWHDSLPKHAGEADLLISECVFFDREFEYHLNHVDLHRYRDRFRCKRIILTHLGTEVLANLERVRFENAEDGLRICL